MSARIWTADEGRSVRLETAFMRGIVFECVRDGDGTVNKSKIMVMMGDNYGIELRRSDLANALGMCQDAIDASLHPHEHLRESIGLPARKDDDA